VLNKAHCFVHFIWVELLLLCVQISLCFTYAFYR